MPPESDQEFQDRKNRELAEERALHQERATSEGSEEKAEPQPDSPTETHVVEETVERTEVPVEDPSTSAQEVVEQTHEQQAANTPPAVVEETVTRTEVTEESLQGGAESALGQNDPPESNQTD